MTELEKRMKSQQKYPQMYPERRMVVCAACKMGDLVVMSPRHWDIPMHWTAAHLKGTLELRLAEQGFVDQWGVFMTREEAYQVAKRQGQIRYPENGNGSEKLFSEMLY